LSRCESTVVFVCFSLRREVLTTKKRKWYVGSPIYVTIVAAPAVTGVVGGLVCATWV